MPPPEPGPAEMTRFLNALGAGSEEAAAALMPAVCAELRAIADAHMARERGDHTLQPTALVNEAFLRLFSNGGSAWNDRRHFFALAARTMRRVLVDHARQRKSLKRGGDRLAVTLSALRAEAPVVEPDLLDLDLAIEELEAEDEQTARIVELRYFAGLEVAEVADVLKVSKSTVERGWRAARAWLGVRLERGAEPSEG